MFQIEFIFIDLIQRMRGVGVKRKVRAEIREKMRNGASIHVLSDEYEVSIRTIYRILEEKYSIKRKRGRKNALTSREARNLIRKSRENPMLSASKLAKAVDVCVSTQTVRNILKRNQFRNKRVKRLESISASNKEKRLQFAQKHVTWGKKMEKSYFQ